MDYHNGMEFYTKDKDTPNDCASSSKKGGWWYTNCASLNPNGPYENNENGLYWEITSGASYIYPKTFQMLIRPSQNA